MMCRDAALGYARRGWRVIPLHSVRQGRCTCAKGGSCPTPGKHPLSERWQQYATTDAAQIRRWWHHRAEANIGLATGGGSGFFVVDVDPRHGGDESLRLLEQTHGQLPNTVVALTGGGGRQLYFAHPGIAVPNSVGALGPGLDVRGDGGLVVAPPSQHRSGQTYAWEVTAHPDEVPITPAPPWLLARLRERAGDRLRADGTPLVLREGERNDGLFRRGAWLRRYGTNEAAIRDALTAINREHCHPPLPADEITRIAGSAARYAPDERAAAVEAAAPESPTPADTPAAGESLLFVRACQLSAPPVTWLVEDLVADTMLQVLSGKDKRGKTLLALEIGRAVLRGAPLFGRFATRQGAVMAALLDDPLGLTLARLDTLGVRGAVDDFYVVDPTKVTDPRTVLDHLAREAPAVQPALVILDALYLFLPGGNNAGNDAASMRPLMVRLNQLVEETGAAVLVVAHDNKGGTDVAGSYVVRAMAKAVLRLTVPKEQSDEDQPDEPTTPQRMLTLESKLVAATAHLLELRNVGAWALLGDPRNVRADQLSTTILRRLRTGLVGTAEEIAKAVGKRRETVEEVLDSLVRAGDATQGERPSRGRRAMLYMAAPLSVPPATFEPAGPDGKLAPQTTAEPTLFSPDQLSVLPSAPREIERDEEGVRRERVTL